MAEIAIAAINIIPSVLGLFGRKEKQVDLSPLIESHNRELQELKNQMAASTEQQKAEFEGKLGDLRKQFDEERKQWEDAKQQNLAELARLQGELDRPIRARKAKVEFVNRLQINPRRTRKKVILGHKGDGKSTYLWLSGKGPQPSRSSDDGTTTLVDQGDYIDTIGLKAWDIHYVAKMLVLLMDFMMPSDVIVCISGDRIVHALTALANFGITAPLVVILTPSSLYSGLTPIVDMFTGDNLPADLEYKVENGIKVFPRQQLRNIYNTDAITFVKRSGLGTCITHQPPENAPAIAREHSPFANFTFPFVVTEAPMDLSMEVLFRFTEIYHRKYKQLAQGQLLFMNKATLKEFEDDY